MNTITKFFLVFCFFTAINLNAQQAESFSFEKQASINLSELPPSWHAKVFSLEAPFPGSDSYRNYIHQLKRLRYGDRTISSGTLKTDKKTSADNPVYETGFDANYFGGIPNDNDIAISNGGMVVSVSNSEMFVYDELGTELLNVALEDFSGNSHCTYTSWCLVEK